MSDKSSIEWTESTWNPVTGCSKISPGCAHCYAERISLRFGHSKKPWLPEHAADNVLLHPERLEIPLRWQKPRRVFVNSMSDLFHELIPDEFIDDVFAVMAKAERHTFQVLTKRPERMLKYMRGRDWCDAANRLEHARLFLAGEIVPPLPNVWLGVSAENQHWADVRIPILMDSPAAVRFVSAEPLLGPVNLSPPSPDGYRFLSRFYGVEGFDPSGSSPERVRMSHAFPRLDWVIVGGESGPGARPMDPDWARSIRDQCVAAGVPLFFKQWGGRTPRAGGRELDGRTWDEMPRDAT